MAANSAAAVAAARVHPAILSRSSRQRGSIALTIPYLASFPAAETFGSLRSTPHNFLFALSPLIGDVGSV